MEEMADPKSPVEVVSGGATHVGRVREHNEDAILVRPDLGLYVVADGAGGHNAGNVASALAIAVIENYFEATEEAAKVTPSFDRFGISEGARRLSNAIHKANRDVVEISRTSKAHGGMGSTVVAMFFDPIDPVVHVAHVGDSRCYRMRGPYIERMTHDHSVLNDVLELKPDMPERALARLPRKVVTRALGMEENARVSVRTFEVGDGDSYLLCSDGLTSEVDDVDIRDTILCTTDPSDVVKRLIEMAIHGGGRDNIAVVFLQCARAGMFALRRAPESAPPESDGERKTGLPEMPLTGDVLGALAIPAGISLKTFADEPCARCGAYRLLEDELCPQCGERATMDDG